MRRVYFLCEVMIMNCCMNYAFLIVVGLRIFVFTVFAIMLNHALNSLFLEQSHELQHVRVMNELTTVFFSSAHFSNLQCFLNLACYF